ncbi:ragulator complex protein LAMTOR1-like isoform X1 [Oscarella lobularis]|uniref:ragulator complex protein LAMTOR1-like isoform X1 n=1 Tax=Oscarella lobularis TaxID=121494 RepID=UPI0033131E46
MGNCCDGGDQVDPSEAEPNEKSKLMRNPEKSRPRDSPQSPSGREEFDGPSTSSLTRSTDEQSALSRILHQTATNVIDVTTVEPHSIEQQEYMDKTRQYRSRVSSLTGRLHYGQAVRLPETNMSPYEVLIKPVVSPSDVKFIEGAATCASEAVSKIEVKHTEPLVVPFGMA